MIARALRAGALGAAALALAACAVGPTYRAPAAPKTPGYAAVGEVPGTTASAPVPGGEAQRLVDGADLPGEWWTLFRSTELNALIERGLAHSATLEAAQAALRQANETAAAQRGAYYPSVSGQAQVERQKASGAGFGLPSAGSFLYTLNSASVNVSYTLDVFGGVRRGVESAEAQAEAQRYAMEASVLTLTANIVTAAVTEASLRAQIDATVDIARAQRAQVDITQRRVDAGGAARSDVLQLESALQSTLAGLPPLKSQLAQERNQLAAYLGVLPADYDGPAITLETLTLPSELPVSLPSKLVEQRPDVRQYAALLHQATAEIGVATANMLPQITLTGSVGGTATRFSDVFSPSAGVWSVIASVTQPIFKGGQLVHQRRAAVAAAQEAAANYRGTVITAFDNVSNALHALTADADALAAQTLAERAAAESLSLVQAQYRSGAASQLQVLVAEQNHQTAAINQVKARAQRFADTAALFQALGGGWWNRNDLAADTSDCCKGRP